MWKACQGGRQEAADQGICSGNCHLGKVVAVAPGSSAFPVFLEDGKPWIVQFRNYPPEKGCVSNPSPLRGTFVWGMEPFDFFFRA
jgi:hypothetical protein